MMAASLGVAFVLVALLVPTDVWVDSLTPSLDVRVKQLTQGFVLLRVSLGLLGAYLVVGARLRWWSSGPSVPAESGVTRLELVIASSLFLAGALLRLYRLDDGLWADEVWTLVDYVRPPFGEIATTYDSQGQHFLFSLLAHLSVSVFGEQAWSLRLPSAMFGIGTLWMFWRFARLLASPAEALTALGLLTFSYHHVWFSQNARGYSALLFWSLASTYFLLTALRQPGPSRRWAAYAATAALGMYTHMTMVFVLLGQFTVYVWQATGRQTAGWRERLSPVWTGFSLAAFLTFALYAPVIPQMPEAMASDLSNVARWRSPLWFVEETIGRLFSGPVPAVAAFVGMLVFAAGVAADWRRSGVLTTLFLVPVVSGGAVMIILGHHLWPRFFFFAAGFGVLLAVRGVFVLTMVLGQGLRWSPGRSRTVALGLLVVSTGATATSVGRAYGPKQDFESARDFVEAQRASGDAVVAVGVAAPIFRIYYAPTWQSATTLAELDEIRRASTRTWLVYTLPIELENTFPDIHAAVGRDFRIVRRFAGTLGDGAIFVCLDGPDDRATGHQIGVR